MFRRVIRNNKDDCRWLHDETDTHLFVHANYAPNLPLDKTNSMTRLWLPLDKLPGPHSSGKIAVVGHTPRQDHAVLDAGHLVCIDTGCGYGGLLTALDVDSGEVWQVQESLTTASAISRTGVRS